MPPPSRPGTQTCVRTCLRLWAHALTYVSKCVNSSNLAGRCLCRRAPVTVASGAAYFDVAFFLYVSASERWTRWRVGAKRRNWDFRPGVRENHRRFGGKEDRANEKGGRGGITFQSYFTGLTKTPQNCSSLVRTSANQLVLMGNTQTRMKCMGEARWTSLFGTQRRGKNQWERMRTC